MLPRIALVMLLGLAVPGVFTPPAAARIVLNRSIARVHLDDSLRRVHDVLGKPRRVRRVPDSFSGGHDRIDIYRKLQVLTIAHRVFSVSTTRRAQRAAGNIHVGIRLGSLKNKLRRQHRHFDCFRFRRQRSCRVERPQPSDPAGKATTDFRIRHGRVRQILVGRIVD